ncbi:MAG TPA: UDP-N-acetyl-D-mannosamine dehydrogenase [Anaerolineaceae bacterium]|nr:UDP-N-acetyl-D-mannosamine dehydrogenase [Anaerolineaceae bacterium]
MEFNTICVMGLGYIGLPTASTFASRGIKVIGVDANPRVVESLQNGHVHIYEPGLRELVGDSLASGNLIIRNQPEPADAFIIAVPTPFYDDKKADMRFVRSAAEAIAPFVRQGNLVVLESTSPPMTTCGIVAPILERGGMKAGEDFYLTYSPERVLPGQILRELIENARVIGGVNHSSAEAGRDLYRIFVKGEIILTDATTAEMVKLMENTYRDVNIAIANEFSRLADRFGIDVWEAIRIANLHPRVKILNPGPGVGGHCISVDPWFLVEAAPDVATLIRTSRLVNDSQPEFVIHLVKQVLGEDLQQRRIAVLGLAFKPDVDDLRESPAVDIARHLADKGAQVKAFEPNKPDAEIEGVPAVDSLSKALEDAELVLVLVGHKEFRSLEATRVVKQTPARLLVDAVNVMPAEAFKQAGFRVFRLGVGHEL